MGGPPPNDWIVAYIINVLKMHRPIGESFVR